MSTGCLLQENVSLASVGLGAGTPRQQPAGSNKLLWDENCWGCQLHVRRTSHILLDFRDHPTIRQAPIVHNRQVCPRGLCSNWLLVPLPVCLRARWSARHRFLLCARRPAGRAHFLFLFCLKISFVRFTYRWFVATLLDLRVSILPSHATTFSKVAHFASPSISCKPTPSSQSVSMSLCLCLSCHVQVFQSVGTPYGGHDRFFLPQQSGSYVSSNSLE